MKSRTSYSGSMHFFSASCAADICLLFLSKHASLLCHWSSPSISSLFFCYSCEIYFRSSHCLGRRVSCTLVPGTLAFNLICPPWFIRDYIRFFSVLVYDYIINCISLGRRIRTDCGCTAKLNEISLVTENTVQCEDNSNSNNHIFFFVRSTHIIATADR